MFYPVFITARVMARLCVTQKACAENKENLSESILQLKLMRTIYLKSYRLKDGETVWQNDYIIGSHERALCFF